MIYVCVYGNVSMDINHMNVCLVESPPHKCSYNDAVAWTGDVGWFRRRQTPHSESCTFIDTHIHCYFYFK